LAATGQKCALYFGKSTNSARTAGVPHGVKTVVNTSVQLVLLSKNTAAFNPPDRDTQILELVAMAQSDCERLMLCSQVAKGIHTSGNLFRYLIFLLQKAETEPGLDLFYELASLVEVMVEGFDTVRVS
jgi:hypothetical protein